MKTWWSFWGQPRLRRGAVLALVVWAAAMYALMFVHLRADFPHGTPWSDMSKATDEGWYGGGALHQFVFGHWYLPESFNPTVAMPMWPLMLGGWFSVAGVGMEQARLLTVLLYGASIVLMVRLLREGRCEWLTCAGAALLMLANPFCYVFDRMALLEPASVFWWVMGLWVAARAAEGRWWRAIVVGLAIVALVWTKTTAIVLVVSILYFLGEGADDISMFTGVRAISFYEPYGLQPLLDRYQPGWMGVWLDSEQDFVNQVAPEYELQQVATFRVYDDQPHHNIFVLYRMVPHGRRFGVR